MKQPKDMSRKELVDAMENIFNRWLTGELSDEEMKPSYHLLQDELRRKVRNGYIRKEQS